MGNIIQFPKIHKQYEVKATIKQIHRVLYVLYLHKNIKNGFDVQLFRIIKQVYTKPLKEYPFRIIRTVFDHFITNDDAYFPSLQCLLFALKLENGEISLDEALEQII